MTTWKEESEIEELVLSEVKFTKMVIGNHEAPLLEVDLTKPCQGKDCVEISYNDDGNFCIK